MRVVGYRDLRPVDWASGKRVPLGPGEGHVCDRCGAEHAVVYELLDEDTGKHYSVGSTCAKRQFGFDVAADVEAKRMVRKARDEDEATLDEARQKMAAEASASLAREVSALPLPDFDRDEVSHPGVVTWRIGDSKALAAFGRSDADTQRVALEGWYLNRIREMIPGGWSDIPVRLHPRTRVRASTTMDRKVQILTLSALASTIRQVGA